MSDYYNVTSSPAPVSAGSSATMRSEFASIAAGFAKLPSLTGVANQLVVINGTSTGMTTVSSLTGFTVTNPVITGGSINNTSIGSTTPSTGAFTTLTASGGYTGNVTGNVTAASGTSTFNNVTINGTLDMNSGTAFTITGLATPTGTTDAATKGYVDTALANLVNSSPATLDTLNEIATALGNDPNFATTMTTALGNKLSLSGGTMSGAIAMGNNKITGLGTPTVSTDACTLGYVTTLYGSTAAAATSAANAATSESNAATSASNASTSASNALTYLNTFKGQYYGALSADPTLDPLGAAMTTGDLYFNSSLNQMKAYNGSSWQVAYNPASGSITTSGYTQNTARLLGRTTASAGAIEEISVGSGLSLSAGTLSASASATLTVSNKTTAYSVVAGDNGTIIRTTSGTGTISLPSCATVGVGFNFIYINASTAYNSSVDVSRAGSDTMQNGANSVTTNPYSEWKFICVDASASGKWQVEQLANTGFGSASTIIGANAKSSGGSSVVIGPGAQCTGSNGVAIGYLTQAIPNYSVAIGNNSAGQASTTATGAGAMALGGSYASGVDSFAAAIANNTSTYGAQGANSVAIGSTCLANTTGAVAVGYSASATGLNSAAFGYTATAAAQNAVALGPAYASGTFGFAVGQQTNSASFGAQGSGSIAMGYQTLASGNKGIAIGISCTDAQGNGAMALGMFAKCNQNKLQYATGVLAAQGDAQYGLMVLRAAPASGSTGVLTSDLAGAGTTNQLVVASGQAMTVTGMIVGKVTGTAQVYSAHFTAQLINNGGTVTLGAAVTLANVTDGITLTTAPTVTADNTNKGLSVTSGAKTATVIKWVCTVQSCEITY